VRRLGEGGLAALYDTWLQTLARESLAQTRFDPRNSAASEQRLFDALPGWLQTLCEQERAGLALDAEAHVHRVEVERSTLVDAAAGFYQPLQETAAQAGERPLLLRERLVSLPGLAPALAGCCNTLIAVDCAELALALLRRPEALAAGHGEERPYLASLGPVDGTAEAVYRPGRRPPPTHLVCRGIAHRLTAEGLSLGGGVESGRRDGIAWIRRCEDGEVRLDCPQGVAPQVVRAGGGDGGALSAGDRFWLDAEQFELIAVQETDEA